MDVNRHIGGAAAFAQMLWVVAGLYLYVTAPPGITWLSVSAAVFFVAGLIAAPAIGMAFYALNRAIESARPAPAGLPAEGAERRAPLLNGLVLIVEAVLILVVASWAFERIEAYRTGVPVQYVEERDNFDYALKAFAVANEMEEQAKVKRDSGQIDAELETRVVELIEAGVARGGSVSNEFLTYLHAELPQPYRTQLMRGYEMLAQGRRSGNLPLQSEGNDLVRIFYQEFLPPRADAILGKVGARLE